MVRSIQRIEEPSKFEISRKWKQVLSKVLRTLQKLEDLGQPNAVFPCLRLISGLGIYPSRACVIEYYDLLRKTECHQSRVEKIVSSDNYDHLTRPRLGAGCIDIFDLWFLGLHHAHGQHKGIDHHLTAASSMLGISYFLQEGGQKRGSAGCGVRKRASIEITKAHVH